MGRIIRRKLPSDPSAIVFGAASLGITMFGICCGVLAPVALTLGIIGILMANKDLREFESRPQDFDLKSKSNVATGKALSIFGVAVSALMIVALIVAFLLFGKSPFEI